MAKIIWTELAISDINNIAEFIALDSEKFAKIQVQRFFKEAEVLEKFPETGRIVPEIEDDTIRELILGSYRIIYQLISKDSIAIITVHHSKRLLSNNPAFH